MMPLLIKLCYDMLFQQFDVQEFDIYWPILCILSKTSTFIFVFITTERQQVNNGRMYFFFDIFTFCFSTALSDEYYKEAIKCETEMY